MPAEQGKVELLAPAGDMISAIGALNAGADAVYLGTEDFSARAYAKNLSIEETVEMIHYAHLHGKRIYLTMNTLIKSVEWEKAVSVLERLYSAGLDAVIVQDLGLLDSLDKFAPGLEIHASTQMAVLSSYGAEWLKKHHVTRVVPARELSLAELKEMKKTGMELECFIHGAMCYSYSGKCLMSSLAGGRSGNRGRCAGPCRKLYHQPGQKPAYLLSMKDMCSVDRIPELMKAGIDSFKIEGRMKSPEYAAGVTSVYRKAIDRIENGEEYELKEEERLLLEELYIRSELQDGYFLRHNGREMISLSNPAYAACGDEIKEDIRKKFLAGKKRCPIQGELFVVRKEPIRLDVRSGDHEMSVQGAVAEPAVKRAVTDEELSKRISKTGNTFYEFDELKIFNDGKSFVPVSCLNELRRKALEELENSIFETGRKSEPFNPKPMGMEQNLPAGGEEPKILAGVKTPAQLNAVLKQPFIDGVIVDLSMADEEQIRRITEQNIKCYLRLPAVLRQKDIKKIKERFGRLMPALKRYMIEGIYCGSLDALEFAKEFTKETADDCRLIADQGIYIMNPAAEAMILEEASSYTASAELNKKELSHAIRKGERELIIYGRFPMMYSANCIVNTAKNCDPGIHKTEIVDEEGRVFPVVMNHQYCFNAIYNCVPLSLHQDAYQLYHEQRACALRLEFTTENEDRTEEILGIFREALRTPRYNAPEDVMGEYTKGHYNRGVL